MNSMNSFILTKANNCFYVLLNNCEQAEIANDRFKNLFHPKQIKNSASFIDFFEEPYHQQWKNILKHARQSPGNVETVTIPVETDKVKLNIDWNICTILNSDNTIKSFEILGVQSQKPFAETSITTTKNEISGADDITRNHADNIPAPKVKPYRATKTKLVLIKLKKILDSSLDMVCSFDEHGRFTKVSASCKTILGYEPRELICKNFRDFLYEEDLNASDEMMSKIKDGLDANNFENRCYKKDGSLVTLSWSARWEEEDKRFYSIARDATEKKAAEAALKASEEKYKMLFYNHPIPMYIFNPQTSFILKVNEAALKQYGYAREEFLNLKIKQLYSQKDVKKLENCLRQKENMFSPHKGIWTHQKKNKEEFSAEITSTFINYEGANAKLVMAFDRTEQVKAEEELKDSNEKLIKNEQYIFLSKASFDAIWDCNLKTKKIQWGEGVKKLFGLEDLSAIKNINGWLQNLHPEDRERVANKLKKHFHQRQTHWQDEYRFVTADNACKYISARGYTIYDESNKPVRMIGAMQDLTERKTHENMLQQLNNNLEKRARELSESNAELERFAYVASHDLQEPLRMVSSFLQLLNKRYKDKLDQKAHEYIAYAVDGAERMKRLILDLLEYSRVNSSITEKEDVDINEVIDDLRRTYKNLLRETNGTIYTQKLPLVKGNKTQILQLFQNLIGNALKYRSDKPPVINVFYKEENNAYKFSIADNGIGIDAKFFQKIFIIFQRLHQREQYSGTGIGLAICKKIIEKHGGKIWLDSTPGHGSTFYFTLPKTK